MHNRRIALVMALLGALVRQDPVRISTRPTLRGALNPLRRFYRSAGRRPHDGEQEKARRRAQIERGQLTRSNGLVRHV